jgi:hypothetical protein
VTDIARTAWARYEANDVTRIPAATVAKDMRSGVMVPPFGIQTTRDRVG